jgi:hypothetical protein
LDGALYPGPVNATALKNHPPEIEKLPMFTAKRRSETIRTRTLNPNPNVIPDEPRKQSFAEIWIGELRHV